MKCVPTVRGSLQIQKVQSIASFNFCNFNRLQFWYCVLISYHRLSMLFQVSFQVRHHIFHKLVHISSLIESFKRQFDVVLSVRMEPKFQKGLPFWSSDHVIYLLLVEFISDTSQSQLYVRSCTEYFQLISFKRYCCENRHYDMIRHGYREN